MGIDKGVRSYLLHCVNPDTMRGIRVSERYFRTSSRYFLLPAGWCSLSRDTKMEHGLISINYAFLLSCPNKSYKIHLWNNHWIFIRSASGSVNDWETFFSLLKDVIWLVFLKKLHFCWCRWFSNISGFDQRYPHFKRQWMQLIIWYRYVFELKYMSPLVPICPAHCISGRDLLHRFLEDSLLSIYIMILCSLEGSVVDLVL